MRKQKFSSIQMLARMNMWPKGERFCFSLPVSGVIRFPENLIELNCVFHCPASWFLVWGVCFVLFVGFFFFFFLPTLLLTLWCLYARFLGGLCRRNSRSKDSTACQGFLRIGMKKNPGLWSWCVLNSSKFFQSWNNYLYLLRLRAI